MIIPVVMNEHCYDVILDKNILNRVEEHLDLNRKVLIVSDDGVPSEYYNFIASKCKEYYLEIIPHGENSKSIEMFEHISEEMLKANFSRNDCIIAVGGGVVGDLSGFVASCYMRGIDFYNIPTTLLSQVDSSIGGKTAVNFCGIKNSIGSFYQPKKVIIDPTVLKTLDSRQFNNGLVEVIKIAATLDKNLFDKIKLCNNINDNLMDIIYRSIMLKKKIIEEDPNEIGIRKVLNFGHTIGHAIETTCKGNILHGEAVAIGMILMCSEVVRKELIPVFTKYNIPINIQIDFEKLFDIILNDKKRHGDIITEIIVDKIGSYYFEDLSLDEIIVRTEKVL